MTNTKQYFTTQEAMEDVKNYLENGGNCYGCDLHNEVFNTDYYIIGTYEAKKALEQYGTFEAIEAIKTYEEDNFGELYTDLSDPEKVANMLYYIIGYEAMEELNDILDEDWNNEISDETRQSVIAYIRVLKDVVDQLNSYRNENYPQ